MARMVALRSPTARHEFLGLLAHRARRAARLLLREPDAGILAELGTHGHARPRSLEALRIEFVDRLCHPESARYVAPCEHVFRRRWQTRSGWRFPPPEPAGTEDVERHYADIGFRVADVTSCSELAQAPPQADHLGVMLLFAAACMGGAAAPPVLAAFTRAHLGIWVEEFCLLLAQTDPGEYLRATADTALDAVQRIRQLCTGDKQVDAG